MFDWNDYLDVAERLLADAGDEAALRSGISRAYYAAYHAAAAFVRANGLLLAGHTHLRVWAALKADPDAQRRDIGRRGDRLRLFRAFADYRNPFPDDLARVADNTVSEARALIAALDALG